MFDTLHSAIFSAWSDGSDLSKVQKLLDEGHDVNGLDDDGCTPLVSAAMVAPMGERSELATRLLLEAGADPNLAQPGSGRGPLAVAVCGIGTGTVRALLEGGSDPNATCDRGATPIHHALGELRNAARSGSFDDPESAAGTAAAFVAEHLKSLVAHGADVNRPTPSGITPLLLAFLIDGCPDPVIDALLDGGAVVEGQTISVDGADVDLLACCIFCELSAHVAVRMLDAGCPWDVPYAPFGDRTFLEVVSQYRPEMALALAQHSSAFAKALVGFRTPAGLSVLVAAARSEHEPLMAWLVQHGLRPDEVISDGRTLRAFLVDKYPDKVALLDQVVQDAAG